MPFETLTPEQTELIIHIVELINTENFEPEFNAAGSMGGWFILMHGKEGKKGKQIDDISKTTLIALREEEYLTLEFHSSDQMIGSPKPKAFQEYKVMVETNPNSFRKTLVDGLMSLLDDLHKEVITVYQQHDTARGYPVFRNWTDRVETFLSNHLQSKLRRFQTDVMEPKIVPLIPGEHAANFLNEYGSSAIGFLESLISDVEKGRLDEELLNTDKPHPSETEDYTNNDDLKRNVFVVHGRNLAARDAVFDFIRALDLHPIEWSEARKLTSTPNPYIGEILDAAFAHAQAILVLFTPDDIAHLNRTFWKDSDQDYEKKPTPQARPNVLFEAGMAVGRDIDRTIFVEIGSLRPFSDIGGRHTLRLNNSSEARHDFAQRLEDAGLEINRDGTAWISAGNFDPDDLGIEQIYSAIEFENILREDDYLTRIDPKKISFNYIRDYIFDFRNSVSFQTRALEYCLSQGHKDEDFLKAIAYDDRWEIRQEFLKLLREYEIEISEELMLKLLEDRKWEVARSAVDTAFLFAKKGLFASDIFIPSSSQKYFKTQEVAVQNIIKLDDEKSVETLDHFKYSTYHKIRKSIADYYERLCRDGRLEDQNLSDAISILQHFIHDGESSDTTKEHLLRVSNILKNH